MKAAVPREQRPLGLGLVRSMCGQERLHTNTATVWDSFLRKCLTLTPKKE